MAFRRKQREDLRVDLTPMIDVVFLLLIFFMISTTFVETSGLSIKLPEASTTLADQEPKEIKVYLSKEGVITVDKQEMSVEALKAHLKSFGKKGGEMTFLLYADKEALHGRVVELMDSAKQAEFGKLAIATEQPR
ncbi:MAG: biopolymer transporter ExbD [Desulfuromonadales bacterium]|nr:biopolymer transporter ExbD [Desulfuromonadales bacterium]